MSVMADKLNEAMRKKNNDIKNFIWKGERMYDNNKVIQYEFPMSDATEAQLKKWYAHCKSMLYSNDKNNPGRYTLLEQIQDQRNRCNAQLFMLYLRDGNHPDGHRPYPSHMFFNDLREFLNKPETLEVCPRSKWSSTKIIDVMQVPADYAEIPIAIVLEAALDNLGVMNFKHITTNFLAKMGLWFTKDEVKWFLTQKDENGNSIDRLQLVRQNMGLRPELKLFTNPKGGLSYTEFNRIHKMKDTKYSEIPSDTLKLLRNKILFKLEDDARRHIAFWEEKIRQIKLVCEVKEFNYE